MLLTWKFFKTRKLHYLLPAFFLVVLSHVYAWFWHAGLMLPCVIALLWMTWPRQTSPFRKLPLYEQLPALMLLLDRGGTDQLGRIRLCSSIMRTTMHPVRLRLLSSSRT